MADRASSMVKSSKSSKVTGSKKLSTVHPRHENIEPQAELSTTVTNGKVTGSKKLSTMRPRHEPQAELSTTVTNGKVAADVPGPATAGTSRRTKRQRPRLWTHETVRSMPRLSEAAVTTVDLSVLSPESISKYKKHYFGRDDPNISMDNASMTDEVEVLHLSREVNENTNPVDQAATDMLAKPIRQRRTLIRTRRVRDSPSRSFQMHLTHDHSTHDEPGNAEVIDPNIKFAIPTNLIVTGVLHVFLGFTSLSISMVLYFANSIIEGYLEVSGSHTHAPAFFVFSSEVLTVVAGFGLILCLLYNLNFFYRLYPHLLWMIVMFDFVAIAFSFGSWRYLNMNTYARMFESETMIFCEGNYEYYNILWDRHPDERDPEPRIWSRLEAGLRCCGFNGARDWDTMCNGRVPLSCCRLNSTECQQQLKDWNTVVKLNSSRNFSAIRHLLYQKSCRNVLSLEASSIQRDWILFPFIIGIFDLILMLNGNHKTREITFKLQSSQGRKELAQFRHHCWLKLKCKTTKVAPSCIAKSGNRDDLHDLDDMGEVGFVTDRDSLADLVRISPELRSNFTSVVTLEGKPY